jgi:hypothetical protein
MQTRLQDWKIQREAVVYNSRDRELGQGVIKLEFFCRNRLGNSSFIRGIKPDNETELTKRFVSEKFFIN